MASCIFGLVERGFAGFVDLLICGLIEWRSRELLCIGGFACEYVDSWKNVIVS